MKRTTVTLACDGPGCTATRQGQPGETLGELLARLHPIGWRRAGSRDMCENCMARGHRP